MKRGVINNVEQELPAEDGTVDAAEFPVYFGFR